MAKETGVNTHRANQRGYAAGQLVEDGEIVPAGVTVSTIWMDAIGRGKGDLAEAIEEASDPKPKDVDPTKLSKPALEAMAAERGINVGGLDKAELITAIKAAHETDAG